MLSGSACSSLFVAACHAIINIKFNIKQSSYSKIFAAPRRAVLSWLRKKLAWNWNLSESWTELSVPLLYSGFLWREIDFINSEHMSESFTKVPRKGKCGTSSRTKANSIDRSIRLKPFRLWSMETLLFVTGRPRLRRVTAWISKGRFTSLLCAYLSPSNLHAVGVVSFIPPRFLFSHAINLYLIEKYAPDDYLYPKHDFLLRTAINDRLFFDAGFLFPRGLNLFVSIWPKVSFLMNHGITNCFSAAGFDAGEVWSSAGQVPSRSPRLSSAREIFAEYKIFGCRRHDASRSLRIRVDGVNHPSRNDFREGLPENFQLAAEHAKAAVLRRSKQGGRRSAH